MTQAVIRHRAAYFTKQMFDISAEYSVIIHRICRNSLQSYKKGAALRNSRKSFIRSTSEKVFAVSHTHYYAFVPPGSVTSLWCYHGDDAIHWFVILSYIHSFFKSSISCPWPGLSRTKGRTKAIRLVCFRLTFVYYQQRWLRDQSCVTSGVHLRLGSATSTEVQH